MPARTRFFAISLASALMDTRRMLALRILGVSMLPPCCLWLSVTFLAPGGPKGGSGGHRGRFHLDLLLAEDQPPSKSLLPAEMVSAAMAATVSPAASLTGKVPLVAGGIEEGALMSAMM